MANQDRNNDQSRLDLVRSHVADGFYNRRDVVEATAAAVIRSQALHILLDRYELDHLKTGSNVNQQKNSRLDEIRRKIDDGFYDDPNHLADLAEKLIKKLELE